MNSQPPLLDNALPTLAKRLPVIQVQELPLSSPTGENNQEITFGLVEVVGKAPDVLIDSSKFLLEGLKLKRPYSGGGDDDDGVHGRNTTSRPQVRRRSSSFGSIDANIVEYESRIARKERFVGLHKTRSVDSAGVVVAKSQKHGGRNVSDDVLGDQRPTLQHSAAPINLLGPLPERGWFHASQLPGYALNGLSGIVAPPTPPEDLDSFKWGSPSHANPGPGVRTASTLQQSSSHSRPQEQRPSSASRPSEIRMPEPSNMAQDESSRSNWLGRASQHLVSHLGDSNLQQQVQMVVQALPSKTKSPAMRPVFDKVVEDIQAQFTSPPYITITHAYYEAISMDEVPASPPATPNANYSSAGDDYFQDQTIFTHAAAVPAYHSRTSVTTVAGPRPSNIIAAPSSIQVSILERYIPPTTPQEVTDFFTLSRRSYLADRLLELASNDGSLLLIYPTKRGGQTFANRYIGPIIEPFLRQFILLNSLYTEVATELGRMAAVAGMKSFDEMKVLLAAMCAALTQRAPSRGLPSRYEVVHAETAEVVLDRALWKDWYVEQEQPRLRQCLVDYHKSGGRMPARSGQIEITPGMLTREVIDGVRQSREAAGNVGLEVGVFVIRRSTVT